MTNPAIAAETPSGAVAIVGMDGRFPGADDPDELWQLVANGAEGLDDLSVTEVVASGVPADLAESSRYVRRSGNLRDPMGFDAEFFGIGPSDAAVMDPQHRQFLECAWGALESSGNLPGQFEGAIGVFGGCGANTYLLHNLLTNRPLVARLGWFLLRHTGNDKDFLTNNVAYRLDLRGPAVNVQTACSTSLVALHLAVQSLLAYECDLALAGGATIEFPLRQGYEFREGEILAPDGHCRAFDVDSAGTVLTSGVGVVALRRLEDALADGDPVLAVVRATAVNNDGGRKVGFLAPSVDGHADVIKEALTVAGLSARDIQLFEAHGTGTAVGDPIEVAAITEAFRAFTSDTGFCRLVSTKPNIGHLDTAAGVASVIKVVQSLRHATLPPLANFTGPNPLLNLAASPLTVSVESAPWPSDRPRRAGISSLGVGGTNAHVILEEAPTPSPLPAGRALQTLALSARTDTALAAQAERLAARLSRGDLDLADVAHTLAAGRRPMSHRRVVTASSCADAVEALRGRDQRRAINGRAGTESVAVAFMFPGGGAQYPGMGSGLGERFRVFRETRDEALQIVRDLGGPNLEDLLAPGGDSALLRQPTASLPAVFSTSVALARQWMADGVEANAFIPHSLGEYVAAHLAGVMSLRDALTLVVARSQLMERSSAHGAAMLVVPLGEDEVRALLPDALSLATINTADECVIAGPADAVAELAATLERRGSPGQVLPLAAAAHSSLLDPVLDEFEQVVRGVSLAPPTVRYPSNLTGTWITPEQATDPRYWVAHLRGTVRFSDCLETVLAELPTVVTELGPGHALSSYARRHRGARPVGVVPSLRHPDHHIDDDVFTLNALAGLWAHGASFDLARLTDVGRRKLALPTYPFDHTPHSIEPNGLSLVSTSGTPLAAPARTDPTPTRIEDPDRATWLPSWSPVAAPTPQPVATGRWSVVAAPDDTLASGLAAELTRRGAEVRLLDVGDELPDDLGTDGLVVVAGTDAAAAGAERRWLHLAPTGVRAIGRSAEGGRFIAVTRQALGVDGRAARSLDAMAAGVVAVAPKEYPTVATLQVDVDADVIDGAALADDVLSSVGVVALRRGDRVGPTLARAALPQAPRPPCARGANFVVTGGLSGVGHVLAAHLAQAGANLAIVSSAPLPPADQHDRWTSSHGFDDPTSRRIRALRHLASYGTKVVVVVGDAAEESSIRNALAEAGDRLGPLDGAIHAAGVVNDRLLEFAEPADHLRVVRPKVVAAQVLADWLTDAGRPAQLVLVSSTSTVLAPAGQTAYVAANAVLDSMAGEHDQLSVTTVDFGLWSGLGIASELARRARLELGDAEPIEHPVFTERQRRDGATSLVGRLDVGHHWVVDEHRTTDGQAVLPGTAQLALMVAAAEHAGHTSVELASVSLVAPVLVSADRPVTIRVTAGPADDDGVADLQLESDGGSGTSWQLHSVARLLPTPAILDGPPPPLPSVPTTPIDPLAVPRRGLVLGPHWDCVEDAGAEPNTATARLRLDARYTDEVDAWRAHPALLDVATAVGVFVVSEDREALHVPIGYDRVVIRPPVPAAVTVEARRHRDPTRALTTDIVGVAADGSASFIIDGLAFRPLDATAGFSRATDLDAGPTAAGQLTDLADELGLRPQFALGLVDRLLAADTRRAVVSSIDIDDLLVRVAPPSRTDSNDQLIGSSVEAVLTTIWSELLGVDDIGSGADFFDLGGHSLIAIRMLSQVHDRLGVRLQLATIFDAPTIDLLAARLRAERPDLDDALARTAESVSEPADDATPHRPPPAAPPPRANHLVTISGSGDKRPLFIVHGAGGGVLFLWGLGRAWAGDRPVYAFQAAGTEGGDAPDPSIRSMAIRYAAELTAAHPGPYLLGGYSSGGLIALEMVNELAKLGERADYVVLFDSTPGVLAIPAPLVRRRNLVRHLAKGRVRELVPYLRYVVANRWRALRGEAGGDEVAVVGDDDVLDLFWHVSEKAAEHPLSTYPVDVLLVKAELNWPGHPDDYYWGPHIQGTVDQVVATGEHGSMFRPGNVEHLARLVADALDARERRGAHG